MPRVLTPGARFTTPTATSAHGLPTSMEDPRVSSHHLSHNSAYMRQQPSDQYQHRRHPSHPYLSRKPSLATSEEKYGDTIKSESPPATISATSSSPSDAVLPSLAGLALPRPAHSQSGSNDHHPGVFAMRRGSITDPHLHASSGGGSGGSSSHSGSPGSNSPSSSHRPMPMPISTTTSSGPAVPTLQHTMAGPSVADYGTRRHSIAAMATISEGESMATAAVAAATMADMASRDVHSGMVSASSPIMETTSTGAWMPSRKRTRSPSPSATTNGHAYTSSLSGSSSVVKRYGYETGPGLHPYASTNGMSATALTQDPYSASPSQAHLAQFPLRRNTLPSITPFATANLSTDTTAPPASMHSRRRSSLGTGFTSSDSNGTRIETPYARSPELRITHKLAERRRRQEMKELFDDLREALPVEPHLKTSKWEILTKALETIHRLRANQQEMANELNSLRQQLSQSVTSKETPTKDNTDL